MSLLATILRRCGVQCRPVDRILSARSRDGLTWEREPGVRLEPGAHGTDMLYYCHALALPSGETRLYYYGSARQGDGWRGAIHSALAADGLAFVEEAGERVPPMPGAAHARSPSLTATPGGHRLYHVQVMPDGRGEVHSCLSQDGLAWTMEDGPRLAADAFGPEERILDCHAVALPGGGVRLHVTLARGPRSHICSALAADGLTFLPEPGTRMAAGLPGRRLIASNPCVLLDSDTWRMYLRGGDKLAVENAIWVAESADGFHWREPRLILSPRHDLRTERHAVAFPHVHPLPQGGFRMYYTGFWGKHLGERRTVAGWLEATEKALREIT